MNRIRLSLILTTLSMMSTTSLDAHADEIWPRAAPPARVMPTADDADAISLSPSNLAFIPAWDFQYLHIFIPSQSTDDMRASGDAIGLGIPLPFDFATGFRFEWVRPPNRTQQGAATWALAYQVSSMLSFAFDVTHWFAPHDITIDGADALGLSLSFRPSPYIAFSVAGHDLNSPMGTRATALNSSLESIDVGAAVRPNGSRLLELGFGARVYPYAFSQDLVHPEASLALALPYVGRLTATAQSNNFFAGAANWNLTIGLDLSTQTPLGHTGVGGGVLFGNAYPSGPGWFARAEVGGARDRTEIRLDSRAVLLRIEDTPGTRGHVHLLLKLRQLRRDSTIKAVAFVAKGSLASSTAHAEDISHAIDELKASGIRVLCHLEDANAKTYFACAHADRIVMHPAGGLHISGFSTTLMFFANALNKLGIKPDFVRIGKFKSGPEEFMRDSPTPETTQVESHFLHGIESIYLEHLSTARHFDPKALATLIAKGPYTADEAQKAGLIDAKVFDDELGAQIEQLVGSVGIERWSPEDKVAQKIGPLPKVAVVYLDGDMIDGRSQTIPLLGTKLAGSYSVAGALQSAADDPNVKAVVFRIESPGGSSLAADVIWRAGELLRLKKPVIVSMGAIAASGGYYAASFGAPIYADRATLTGSIGIYYGKADIAGLLSNIGVSVTTERTTSRADGESLYRPFTDEERAELKNKVAQFYALFLDRVSRGRHMTTDEVDSVGQGQIWLGSEAFDRHLVDKIGGFEQALDAALTAANLPDDTEVVDLPEVKPGLVDYLLTFVGAPGAPSSAVKLPASIVRYASAVAPFLVYSPDAPLALSDASLDDTETNNL